jgi:hypothetical protein
VCRCSNQAPLAIGELDETEQRGTTSETASKTTGTWHTTILRGEAREERADEDRFWILVDIGQDARLPPTFSVVPEWWMVNCIHVRHHERIAFHRGEGGCATRIRSTSRSSRERRAVAGSLGSARHLLSRRKLRGTNPRDR